MMSILLTLAIGFLAGYLFARSRGASAPIEPLDEERLSPGALVEIDAAIDRGDKIEAIRIARKDSGAGLAESKAYIDARSRSRRPGDPIER